ncbi:MAG: MotA/TolQ/ExbB proton channel family protein [Lentisphaeria bacterium]|nr:MotA/TolQ/ExbB proton channel family protein [Candidatus Neomarinimicrobiota bacterium]MCF7842213.1 MotA/TolQ/ExbB proton channel family protein [Lentisphaeria bacterium]
MDFATIIGMIIGISLVAIGMYDFDAGSIPGAFFNLQGLAIVLGGTLAATIINYPASTILSMVRVAGKALGKQYFQNPLSVINQLVEYNKMSRKQGLIALENVLPDIENNYMRIGLENAILEKDANKLNNFLQNELQNMVIRHRNGQEMFYNMGTYAPAFGLLGTVMGLILMMTTQGETSSVASFADQAQDTTGKLLHGMGIALVTTFYGVLLANLIFIPIAGKLKTRSDEEVHISEIIMAGIQSIHAKEHPLIMEEKLLTFVDKQTRERHRSAQAAAEAAEAEMLEI